MNENVAKFILRVLDLARDGWSMEDDTPEIIAAAEKIKLRYSELKGTMGFSEAARMARVEFLTSIKF